MQDHKWKYLDKENRVCAECGLIEVLYQTSLDIFWSLSQNNSEKIKNVGFQTQPPCAKVQELNMDDALK